MQLTTFHVPASLQVLNILTINDIQWAGLDGPTAKDCLKEYIDYGRSIGAYFVGLGDYIDTLSPSNRAALQAARLYDSAKMAVWKQATQYADEVYEKFLVGTEGMWLGMVEGHHFYEFEGEHTDQILADKLKSKFLGTSAYINIPEFDFTLWIHHGEGGSGVLPGGGLNKLYHTSAGLQRADVYLMGHNTKEASARLSRPYPVWGNKDEEHQLSHNDIHLINCGGFSKSNIVGHCVLCGRPRGDYAEAKMLTPSPLTGPIITVNKNLTYGRVRVAV